MLMKNKMDRSKSLATEVFIKCKGTKQYDCQLINN